MLDINKINKQIILPSIISLCYVFWLKDLLIAIYSRGSESLWSISIAELSLLCYYTGLLLLSFTLRGPNARFMMFGMAVWSIADHYAFEVLTEANSPFIQSAFFQLWVPVITYLPIVLFLYKMYDIHIGLHIWAAKLTRKTGLFGVTMNAFNHLGFTKYRKPLLVLFGVYFLVELIYASLSSLTVFQYFLHTGELISMDQYLYGVLNDYDLISYSGIYHIVATWLTFFTTFAMVDISVSSSLERIKYSAKSFAERKGRIFQ